MFTNKLTATKASVTKVDLMSKFLVINRTFKALRAHRLIVWFFLVKLKQHAERGKRGDF